MDKAHHPEHERLIERVLSGELPDAPAEIEGCVDCRERLQRLRATIRTLDAAGAEQRQVMAEAAALVGAVGEDRVAALVRRHLPAKRRAHWPRILVALAALLVLGLVFWPRADAHPADRLMNAAGYRPVGRDVSDLAEKGFEWPGAGGSRYVVELYIVGDEFPWDTIRRDESTWVPSADYVQRMRSAGSDWYWQVVTVGGPSQGGPPQGTRSDRYPFSFSR